MRRMFFAIFCLLGIFNNGAFAAVCDAGYYNDNGTCTECSGFRYCPGDDIAHDCPSVKEHQRTTFPDGYDVIKTQNVSGVGGGKTINKCNVIHHLEDRRGFVLDYASYNESTQEYDKTWLTFWYSVNPGYYLSERGSCGTYAYYKQVNKCPAGSYCPGKSKVYCDSSNQSVVHTTTFGIEACPEGYWSNDGASECTGNTIQINWDNTEQSDITANDAGTVIYGGDIRTPRAARHISGKVFTGWTFNTPE